MKLVDTSSWIHQIRLQGNPCVRARVNELLTRWRCGLLTALHETARYAEAIFDRFFAGRSS
jgi:hypothetical protein